MKISAYFLPVEFDTFMESVVVAEESGYARAWIPDSQMIWQDVYVYITRGLAATDRITFGTAVTNPFTRHFTVSASAHATLNQIHPGRVVLGIGRGDSAVRTLGLKPAPTKQLKEIVPKVRELMAGETIDFDGTEVQITWAAEQVPLMMAATGPRNLRVAGGLADIVQLQVGTHPDSVRWAIEHVHAGAEEAGRDPDDVEISILCGMWVSDDLPESLENCRWAPACAANHLADVMRNVPDHGMPEPLTRLVEAQRAHYDYYGGHCENEAEHARWVTEGMIEDFGLAGPAEKVLARVEELAAVGVDEIAPAFLNGHADQMRRVGRDIVPALMGIPT